MSEATARIRRFNRAVTRAVGALDTSYLGRGRPLGAARVLHLAQPEGTDVAEIRETLELDSGLLSRLLRQLEAEGLVTTEAAPDDRRRRIARLTPAGAAEKAEYERLNDEMAARFLGTSPRLREEVLAAADLIATLLNRDHIEIRPADPEDPEALACLTAYYDLLREKVTGLPAVHIPQPDPHAADYRPPHGAILIAWSDGLPLGCVSLHRLEPGLGEVKRLWVDPMARGQGLARRLMRAIEEEARRLGHTRLNLDTNEALTEAIALYRKDGWQDTAPYSPYPATHWFTKVI